MQFVDGTGQNIEILAIFKKSYLNQILPLILIVYWLFHKKNKLPYKLYLIFKSNLIHKIAIIFGRDGTKCLISSIMTHFIRLIKRKVQQFSHWNVSPARCLGFPIFFLGSFCMGGAGNGENFTRVCGFQNTMMRVC